MRLVSVYKRKRANSFITDQEAFILWKEAEYYPKLQIMIGFGLFRGLRIGEIRALNIRDFKNSDFNKVDVIIQKSNIYDEFPLFDEFAIVLKRYITNNVHSLVNGYLFPRRHYDPIEPYLHRDVCNSMFHKFRKNHLIPKYQQFAEKQSYYNQKTGKTYERHRVGFHSLRRYFETKLYENGLRAEEIANVMRYTSPKHVFAYLNAYDTWKKEKQILTDTFGDVFKNMLGFSEGQKQLSEFY